MDKEDVEYTYYWILFNYMKEWNNAICSNIDGPRDYYIKWSNSEWERQISYEIIYMWNLNCDTNGLIYENETDSQTQKRNLQLPKMC